MAGNDSYTKSLLHLNADYTDSAAGGTHTWTGYGNAQIDTSDKKFGAGSLLLDGDGDFIDTPDSADWTMGSGDFTIDMWVKRGDIDRLQYLIGQCNSGGGVLSRAWELRFNADNTVTFLLIVGSDSYLARSTGTITDTTTWHHIAGVRDGNTLRLFIDGGADGTANVTGFSSNDSPNKLAIGRMGEVNNAYFNGRVDEPRISLGIARWTTGFTPSTEEYNGAPLTSFVCWI